MTPRQWNPSRIFGEVNLAATNLYVGKEYKEQRTPKIESPRAEILCSIAISALFDLVEPRNELISDLWFKVSS
jgi:hypothetical protein